MLKYIRAFAISLGYCVTLICIMFVMFAPFYFIITYIPPSTFGINLMLGWLVVVLAALFSPLFVKD